MNVKSHNKCQKADAINVLEVNSRYFDAFVTFDKINTFVNFDTSDMIVRSKIYSI